MNPLQTYKALYPQSAVITTDFSKLESKVVANVLKGRTFGKSQLAKWQQCFGDAALYGTTIHQMLFDEIHIMPRRLYSFHPARNNQVVTTQVQTLEQLQEALDLNPDFTHISAVNDGKAWLIHKGPITGRSATRHSEWKGISVKRLPKPIRMHLVIDPL